jgi:hypothetical protein
VASSAVDELDDMVDDAPNKDAVAEEDIAVTI